MSHQHLVTFNDLDDCWEHRGEVIYQRVASQARNNSVTDVRLRICLLSPNLFLKRPTYIILVWALFSEKETEY